MCTHVQTPTAGAEPTGAPDLTHVLNDIIAAAMRAYMPTAGAETSPASELRSCLLT